MFVKQLLYVRPPYSAYHKKRPGFSAVINNGGLVDWWTGGLAKVLTVVAFQE